MSQMCLNEAVERVGLGGVCYPWFTSLLVVGLGPGSDDYLMSLLHVYLKRALEGAGSGVW